MTPQSLDLRGSAAGRTGFQLSPLTRLGKEWRVAFSWFRSVVLNLFGIIDSSRNTKITVDFLPRKIDVHRYFYTQF